MPQRIPGVFEKYTFEGTDEIASAFLFTPMQLMRLQTLQATLMQELVGLSTEGSKFSSAEIFLREHQLYRGKIEILEELISEHDRIEAEMLVLSRQTAAEQALRNAKQGQS